MKVKFLAMSVCVAFLLLGCAPTLEEVDRVRSPDGLLEAAIFIRQTDATVATPFEVYVMPTRGVPTGDPVWRSDKVAGLKIVWISDSAVEVTATKARVFLSQDSLVVGPLGKTEKRKVSIIFRIGQSL